MAAEYPLDMKRELDLLHDGFNYLVSIGLSYEMLDSLMDAPQGTVKAWMFRGADGFRSSILFGLHNSKFVLIVILSLLLKVWEKMQQEVLRKINEDHKWEAKRKFWDEFANDVLSLGGASPYKGKAQNEELTVVPNALIRRDGLQPERIAQILADYFPIYGVETELDFYNACDKYAEFQAANQLKRMVDEL